jgi:hypothetical protein
MVGGGELALCRLTVKPNGECSAAHSGEISGSPARWVQAVDRPTAMRT